MAPAEVWLVDTVVIGPWAPGLSPRPPGVGAVTRSGARRPRPVSQHDAGGLAEWPDPLWRNASSDYWISSKILKIGM
ncbi:hypothetical protein GCM10027194_30620 [Thalassiella azotivora]